MIDGAESGAEALARASGLQSPTAPPVTAPTVAEILRVLGVDVNYAILRRLSRGPLRSEELKRGIASYSPRTVERRLPDLLRLGAIVQERDERTVPPAVIYRLADAGRDLLRVLEVEAVPRVPDRPVADAGIDDSTPQRPPVDFKLLAEVWESGIAERVVCEAQAHTELANQIEVLSYHQLGRRLNRLASGGMLQGRPGKDRRTRYEPTEALRRGLTVALAAVGRWRHRHLASGGGLSATEASCLLLCALPLLQLPECAGEVLTLAVVEGSQRQELIWARAGRGGRVSCGRGEGTRSASWIAGTTGTWIAALLDGKRGRLRVGGEPQIADAYARGLHLSLRGEVE